MMREQKLKEPSGEASQLPPIIKLTFKSTPNLVVPFCAFCKLARAKKRSPGVIKQTLVPEKEGILSCDKYEPGDLISTDQFVVGTPGRLMSGYGRETKTSRYHGGTIYDDAGSGVTWIANQVSLSAGETLLGNRS